MLDLMKYFYGEFSEFHRICQIQSLHSENAEIFKMCPFMNLSNSKPSFRKCRNFYNSPFGYEGVLELENSIFKLEKPIIPQNKGLKKPLKMTLMVLVPFTFN